jgi:alpha-glucoside transport system substrate-binding protein
VRKRRRRHRRHRRRPTPTTDEGDELPGAGTGGNVTISGPETGAEADGFNAALDAFAEESDINATYSGSRDFETQVRVAAEGGNLPDLAVIPQPGLVADLVDQITPVPQDTLDAHRDEFDPYLWDLVTIDDEVYGVPNKGDVKSLVWYSPSSSRRPATPSPRPGTSSWPSRSR